MALIHIDGFDAGDATIKANVAVGSFTSSTSTRFSSGRSLSIGGNTTLTKYITASSQVFVGFAYMSSGLSTSAFLSLSGDGGSTTHLSLSFSSASTLVLSRGGTSIATASVAQPTAWGNYFEISATIADAGGTCVVRVNGVTVINFTGDTKNAGTNSTIDTLTLQTGNEGLNHIFDDLYVCDSTGSAPNNTFLGDVRVYTLVPNGAGASTQFTPSAGANYTDVDELPYSATDYVSASVSGNRDTYTMTDLPAGASAVYGVQNNVIVKKNDAGPVSVKPVIRSGGTNYYGTTKALGTADVTVTQVQDTDPATSAAWTISNVNAVEAGLEVA